VDTKNGEPSRKDVKVDCQYEKKHKGYSWCNLSDNPCFKDTEDCEEYNDLLKEAANENQQ